MLKKVFLFIGVVLLGVSAQASLEGVWRNLDNTYQVHIGEFQGKATFHTRSFYDNGAPSDYFFELQIPKDFPQNPQQILKGRLRSVDGYYGCLFDEELQAQLTAEGALKLHYPLLTFNRVTRSVREGIGRSYERTVEWTSWGWVERVRSFPIERYRVISSECVIKGKNWVTGTLVK
ncbi:hypothetical protein BDW_13100 [Bdellovibrio bacteriovorus W]|nr:hypothetical protein BDW_13100 [Bdellovibrio bacteriovorus W]